MNEDILREAVHKASTEGAMLGIDWAFSFLSTFDREYLKAAMMNDPLSDLVATCLDEAHFEVKDIVKQEFREKVAGEGV